MKLFFAFLGLMWLSVTFSAQTKGDVCHVYVVDVAKAEKALESGNEKLVKEAQTVFPSFTTDIGEEVSTIKTYRFPKSNLFITAKVFYTDESTFGESILLSIAIAPKEKPTELSDTINTNTEIPYNENVQKVRTKIFLKVLKKKYLVGLECDCALKRKTDNPK